MTADAHAIPSPAGTTPVRAPLPPPRCEVLVIGAGPAGSACATALARQGIDVVLVDQHDFPRDKVCGDGLIPDAHAALARLGVLEAVMAQARRVSHVRCVGPRGGHVDVPGTLAVLPRRLLDDLLVKHAVAQGARLFTPLRLEALVEEAGRAVGASLRPLNDGRAGPVEVRASWIVLATGASAAPLVAAGLCERRTPSGVALRGHVRHAAMAERHRTMDVVWHEALRPGYGWVFPCGDDVFNIGVGAFHAGGVAEGNLRDMLDAFGRVHAPAGELLAGGTWIGELKGAPLRCTLRGARSGRPGLLATGEAIGATYDFTGEGIGKALETGLLAAEMLATALHDRADTRTGPRGEADAAVLAAYERQLDALRPRYALYARANRINRHPWLADLVIWRAQRSERLRQRMSGVLNESSNPGHLISARGMLRLLFD